MGVPGGTPLCPPDLANLKNSIASTHRVGHRIPALFALDYLYQQQDKFSSNGHPPQKAIFLSGLIKEFIASIEKGEPNWRLFDGTPYNETMERLRGERGSTLESANQINRYDQATAGLRLNGEKPDVLIQEDGKAFLTIDAAGIVTGLSPSYLRTATRRGKLQTELVPGYGALRFVFLDDLWDFFENRKKPGRPRKIQPNK